MKTQELLPIFERIADKIAENKDKLVELDAAFGDGDLGISMAAGYAALAEYARTAGESDFGRYFQKASKVLNEAAPSSLGTILAFVLKGVAKSLKGKENADLADFSEALEAGKLNVMAKAESTCGEKTMLDAFDPACAALATAVAEDMSLKEGFAKAAEAAKKGADSTVAMQAVHGRAAYHAEKTIGHMDGGAYMVRLVFEAIAE